MEKGVEKKDNEVEKNSVVVRDEEDRTRQTEDEKKVRTMDLNSVTQMKKIIKNRMIKSRNERSKRK